MPQINVPGDLPIDVVTFDDVNALMVRRAGGRTGDYVVTVTVNTVDHETTLNIAAYTAESGSWEPNSLQVVFNRAGEMTQVLTINGTVHLTGADN